MKEVKKILFCLFISIIFSNTVYAISVDAEDISDNSYVIGTNLFTADDNDIYNTEGKNTIYNEADGLFTPAVMFGASSINGSNYSDMVVYYIFDSVWYDALTLDELTAPKNVEITHVNGICVDSSCKGDKFTVTFNAQNFGQSKSVDFDYGDKITSSDLPKLNNRPGYRFVCWTKKDDDECFNFNTSIKDDGELIPAGGRSLTLETKWEHIEYTITYNSNFSGGTSKNDKCLYLDDPSLVSNNCKFKLYDGLNLGNNANYHFKGWSLTRDGKTLYQEESDMGVILGNDANVTLYAIWSADEYSIRYDLGGGVFRTEDESKVIYGFNSETSSINLYNPSRTGFIFNGWKVDNNSFSGSSLPKKDLTVVADWTPISYSFNFNGQVKNCTYDAECELDFAVDEVEGKRIVGLFYTENNTERKLPEYVLKFTTENGKSYNVDVKYEDITYGIYYNLNGGKYEDNQEVPSRFKFDGGSSINLVEPVRKGYNFERWEVVEVDTASINGNLVTVHMPTDIKLKAIWSPIEYSFNYNGETKSCLYDEECEIDFEPDLKAGQEFKNWVIEGSSTVIPNIVKNYTDTASSYNLDIQYNLISYELSYNYDDGKVTKNNITSVKYNALNSSENSYSLNPPVKVGYTFNGWEVEEGSATVTNNTLTITGAGNIRVKALWTEREIIIVYKETASDTGVSETCNYTSCMVKDDEPTKDGHTFIGWEADGIIYKAGSKLQIGENNTITLVANWSNTNSFKINYENIENISIGDGELPPTFISGNEIRVGSPVKDGYTFVGWKIAGTENILSKNDEGVTIITGKKNSITLIANWNLINYNIKYEDEDGTALSLNPSSYTVENKQIQVESPKKAGYTFAGWTLKDNAGADDIIVENDSANENVKNITINVLKDIILVANWDIATYTVTYNYDNSDLENDTDQYTINTNVLTKENPIRTGYEFRGWEVENPVAGNVVLTPSDTGSSYTITINETKNITLKALWEAKKYNVNFYNVDNLLETIECTYGEKCTLPDFTFEAGKRLKGWAIEESGEVKYGVDVKEVVNLEGGLAEVNLYAVLEEFIPVTITIDKDSGEIGINDTIVIESGTTILNLPQTGTKEGYEFDKWVKVSTLDDGTESEEDFDVSEAITTDITIRAKWIKVYTINYQLDGGNFVDSERNTIEKVRTGEVKVLPSSTEVEKSGFTFEKWVIEGTEAEITEVTVDSDLVIVAKWIETLNP